MTSSDKISMEKIRDELIGRDYFFQTPFGSRLLTYADFTSSGRALGFIEKYLIHIQRSYANTHTEDDATGRTMTGLLHQSEFVMKKAFNASKGYCIIATGTGCTGAISKFQEILGVRVPPATKLMMNTFAKKYYETRPELKDSYSDLGAYLEANKPVVFISNYEHHSNDIMWREAFTEVVSIANTAEGLLDLNDLEVKVSDPKYAHRMKIGSISAASNVTGLISPTYEIARIMHKYGGIACYDFAASGPYVKIDMQHDAESYYDAIFLSPHKFLGGPGSMGILVFREDLYNTDLPPTFSAGGTVDYVSPGSIVYTKDIETREKAGTPGIIQTIRAALAIDLKDDIGMEIIEEIEHDYCTRAMERMQAIPNIQILGNLDPTNRIPIISFLIRHGDRYLHPKLGTKLLNDLFGIQSRAGCSCAGVYGHYLLDIDEKKSRMFRKVVESELLSIKPGWMRVNFHYSFSETEFEFILKAIDFIAQYGYKFISLYEIDLSNGDWVHRVFIDKDLTFRPTIKNILKLDIRDCFKSEKLDFAKEYDKYLAEARQFAAGLPEPDPNSFKDYSDSLARELQWFFYINTFDQSKKDIH
ncbi:MAG: aminotransferase class V-fold PLP-dependent enzyme [Promethearchaeota archaeon]